MVLLLWAAAVCVPWVLGAGVVRLLYGKAAKEEAGNGERWLNGMMTGICLGEAWHLAAIMLHRPFSDYIKGYTGMTAVLFLAFILWWGITELRKGKRDDRKRKPALKVLKPNDREKQAEAQKWFAVAFGISVLLQLVMIVTGQAIYRQGDMTVETVQSFLTTDEIYQVNPLTGQAYTAGMPFRIRILGLPSLYGAICRSFSLAPEELVWQLVPAIVLMAAYLTYGCLGKILLSKDKKWIFLLVVSLLFWLGDYQYGMDGFGIMHCGYRGITIRNLVLVPYTIYGCLKRRWLIVGLCIATEACLVWTFYGFGVCLLTAVLMMVIAFFAEKNRQQQKGTGNGASDEKEGRA